MCVCMSQSRKLELTERLSGSPSYEKFLHYFVQPNLREPRAPRDWEPEEVHEEYDETMIDFWKWKVRLLFARNRLLRTLDNGT